MSSGARRAVLARLLAATLAASASCGCGYGPARSGQRGFCVTSGDSRSADSIAQSSLASGMREGLSSAGALGACPPARRVHVEVVRITSVPVAAVQGEGAAIARGVQINVVGRATAELDDGVWTTESEGETSVEVLHSGVGGGADGGGCASMGGSPGRTGPGGPAHRPAAPLSGRPERSIARVFGSDYRTIGPLARQW